MKLEAINTLLMREPKIDDLVIHVNDGSFVGFSYVSAPFREVTDSPPSPGAWAGRPAYYRIDLKDYHEFPRAMSLSEFIANNRSAIDLELREDAPKRYLFILYGGKDVRHAQGAYLTRCTPKLYELIRLNIFGEDASNVTQQHAEPLPVYTIEAFASESAIPQQTISVWLNRLKRKQHLIFQGPPGTGKTYVAERLARILTSGSTGVVETVQFHPSYGYEDFMHGIRPVVQDGRMTFERMPGRFLQFCKTARRVQNSANKNEPPCVLIIDEINRANLSRVFGELMYLLEYRDKAIPLAGEESLFSIPENVYIIGTMNTADRSIALVDHALRRRFSFIHLAPDYDVLRSHLEKDGLDADSLIKALRAVNLAIDDRNYEIGISFFLKDGAALSATLKDVWEGEIEPYLEEYFYDQITKQEPLRWKTLSSSILAPWKVEQ